MFYHCCHTRSGLGMRLCSTTAVTPDLAWEWGYVLPLMSYQIWPGNEAMFYHCYHTRSGLGMRLCTIPAKGINVCGYRADLFLLLYKDTGFHSNKWLSSPHIERLVEVFQILLLFLQLQGLLFDWFDLLFLLSLLQRWWIQLECETLKYSSQQQAQILF